MPVRFGEIRTKGFQWRFRGSSGNRKDVGFFDRLASKLAPRAPARRSDGKSFVLEWMGPRAPRPASWSPKESQVIAQVTLATDQSFLQAESWADGYQRAQQTGRPTIINHWVLLKPDEDSVAAGFTNKYGVSETWLVAGSDGMSVDQLKRVLKYKEKLEWSDIKLHVWGYDFAGKLHFHVRLTPDQLPAEAVSCKGLSMYDCAFEIRDIQISADALIVNCWFKVKGSGERRVYEWKVPAEALSIQEIKSPD